jgi:hypothetical protein
MGRQKSVAQIEKELKYAQNKAAYEKQKPERADNTNPRKQPKIAYAYKPMVIAIDDASAKKYKVQVTEKSAEFFTIAALNLVAAGPEDPLPRGARPAKVHAMRANSEPKVLKAEGSKRPYIRYGDGTRGGRTQYTYTAPISIKSPSSIDTDVKAAFTAVKAKLGGPYGRVWFEPEYFVLSSGGE